MTTTPDHRSDLPRILASGSFRSKRYLIAGFVATGVGVAATVLSAVTDIPRRETTALRVASLALAIAVLCFHGWSVPAKPTDPDAYNRWKEEHAQFLVLRPLIGLFWLIFFAYNLFRFFQE